MIVSTLRERPPGAPFLDITTYHPCYGLAIPSPGGTVRLDHVIVSRYGVFVIERRRHDGRLEADGGLPRWTKGYPNGKRYHVPNPLGPLEDGARALAAALEVPPEAVFPVLVIRGDCELGPGLPENVVMDGPAAYVRGRREPVFTEEEVAELRLRLKHLERKSSPAAAWEEWESF